MDKSKYLQYWNHMYHWMYVSNKDIECLSFEVQDKKNEDQTYIIRISKTGNLFINVQIRLINELTKEYEKEFVLDDIKKDFNKYNSVEEWRKDIIESGLNNCIIEEKGYDSILKIPLENKNYPIISFNLKRKERDIYLRSEEQNIIIMS